MATSENTFSDGASYERVMGRWSKLVGRQFLPWLGLPHGLQWLDAGCGNGAFTEELIDLAKPAAVTGIDPAESQIAYARQRPGTKLATFELGDAQELPFTSGSFDAAVSALVLAFIPNPPRAIAELARVVRPGGTVAAYMWDLQGGGMPLQPMYRAMRKLGLSPSRPPSDAASAEESMREIWHNAGLARVETNVINIQVNFESFDDFWDTCSLPEGPQGKFMQTLAPVMLVTLKEEVRAQLLTNPDGSITYQSFANAVKGRKE